MCARETNMERETSKWLYMLLIPNSGRPHRLMFIKINRVLTQEEEMFYEI